MKHSKGIVEGDRPFENRGNVRDTNLPNMIVDQFAFGVPLCLQQQKIIIMIVLNSVT